MVIVTRKYEDLIGKVFGRLTVMKRAENSKRGEVRFLCVCSCGKETTVLRYALMNNHTRSCGCYNREVSSQRNLLDLTGSSFGRLTVVKRVKNNKRGAWWLCSCTCGNEVVVNSLRLKRGETKSCGCYKRESASIRRKKAYGEASFNKIFSHYKKYAEKMGREFLLSKEEAKKLMLSSCKYCGKKYDNSNNSISKCNSGDFKYNGIDRVDNSIGYVTDNVVPSCRRCNFAKSDYSESEFLFCIKSIYEHLDLGRDFNIKHNLT